MNRDDEPKVTGWKSYYGDSRSRPEEASDRERESDRTASVNAPASEQTASLPPKRPPSQEDSLLPKRTSPQAAYRRRKPRVLLWSFLIALCIVLATVGSFGFYVWNGLRPVASSDKPVRVTIGKGMRASKVAEALEQSGLIRNATLFGAWLKLNNEGSKFQAGEYEMTPGIANRDIVARLNAGKTIAAETIKFTIPEGYTLVQTAAKIAAAAGIDKVTFLKAVSDPAKLNGSVWLKEIPSGNGMRYPVEGYLFPDTYEMKRGSTAADIAGRLSTELDTKLDQLPEDWETTLQERDMTVHELLTIASLVEREVVLPEERPLVASVIFNRLAKKMPLQIDATVQYLLDKPKEKLSTDDLKVESPYNTYLKTGLPPGPIASPSLSSIEAALYPDDTDYLYYVTKKDGTNAHLFASTYRQHQKNIAISEQNEKKAKK